MEAARPTTLYLLCGKIAAGKSMLAGRLARRPVTLLISLDHWMSLLFPAENRSIEDFARLSARLRAAMGPHVVDILRQDVSVVLDFPANTLRWRSWMRSLITELRLTLPTSFMSWMFRTRSARRGCDSEMKAVSIHIKSAKRHTICSRAISSFQHPRRNLMSSSTHPNAAVHGNARLWH